jgi:hypothetical protein
VHTPQLHLYGVRAAPSCPTALPPSCRPQPAELLSTAQAILLLLLLLVQVITLYDNLAIRRLLSAGAAGGGPAAV